VDGDVVVSTPGGAQATFVALNKNTGDVVWKAVVPGRARAGYSSIVVAEAGGVRQYVAYTGDGLFGMALVAADFKTGEVKWSERSVAPGAVAYADGRLYLHGENGEMALVEAAPDAYREHGRFMPPTPPERASPGEKAWAHPLIAEGRLYIRDGDRLWCYDFKGPTGRN